MDRFDKSKWGSVSTRRPGDLVSVQGRLPCGKLGRVETGRVINACRTKSGCGDQVLVSTVVYGRQWFGADGGNYKLLTGQ